MFLSSARAAQGCGRRLKLRRLVFALGLFANLFWARRTRQDYGVDEGIDVYIEHTILCLVKDGDRVIGAFGYERERGRFKIFRARAVVLATGGIGRAYKITSNSWEYTGDGHALAYEAGAELIDMEFIQFHPTGMVWPPSVMGILVTEGVRGEGGILTNKEGRRFMFDDIP